MIHDVQHPAFLEPEDKEIRDTAWNDKLFFTNEKGV